MKTFLIFIFFTVHFYCYSQQATQTHFTDLNEAFKQPNNVQSLRLINYSATVNTLPQEFLKFTELNSLHIAWGEVIDYTQIFEMLSKLPKLKRLELEFYNDSILPPSIGKMKQLQFLKIKTGKLNMLPAEIKGMVLLEELEIISSGWHESFKIAKEIGELSKLKILHFERLGIKEITKEIFQIRSLEQLIFPDNKIKFLSEDINKLGSLVNLDLSYNDLASLPAGIGKLYNLKKLNLSGNKIGQLPVEVYELKSLEILNLNGCGLSAIDSTICDLDSLKGLNLSNNMNLKTLPESIGALPKLNYLYLECTQIKRLPTSLLYNTSIQDIRISPNIVRHKRQLEKEYSDDLYISHSCRELEEMKTDFDKKYGHTDTWMHRFEGDTVQLHYKFNYNEPNSVDEEYTRYVVLKFAQNKVCEGQKLIIPDSSITVYVSSLSMSNWGDYYKDVQGELVFVKIKRNSIRVKLNLIEKYSEEDEWRILDNKILTFHKKDRKPRGYNVMSSR